MMRGIVFLVNRYDTDWKRHSYSPLAEENS